jgi:hypothetical protein
MGFALNKAALHQSCFNQVLFPDLPGWLLAINILLELEAVSTPMYALKR